MKALRGILTIAIFLVTLAGCKKGEDDPVISLRTRKARLAGDWTLKSGTKNNSSTTPNYSYSYDYTYTESGYSEVETITTNGVASVNNYSGSFSMNITFEKDGKFTSTKTQDGNTTITSGTWNFTGGVGEHKNKEQIVLNYESVSAGGTNYSYTGNSTNVTYNIKELRNKRIVLVLDNASSSSGTSLSNKEEYTFEQ